MPELVSRENLQPSLLDRLTDHARFVERITIAYRREALAAAEGSVGQVQVMLESLGLRRVDVLEEDAMQVWDNQPGARDFRSFLELRPRPDMPPLAELIEIQGRQQVPNLDESRDERVISGRRLRQLVLRDLVWLLNTGQMGVVVSLDDYPEVRRSVLNYGVPDPTGMSVSGADLKRLADDIRLAIEAFEPRLRQVVVTPRQLDEAGRRNTVAFVIEGELWGRPLPEQLYLHTELDLEDATVTVREAGDG